MSSENGANKFIAVDPAPEESSMIVNVLPGTCRIGRLNADGVTVDSWYVLEDVRSVSFEAAQNDLWSFRDEAQETRQRQIQQELSIGFTVHRPNAFAQITFDGASLTAPRPYFPISPALLSQLEAVSYDEYRHVPGIPGVSDTCWADKWTSYCYQGHEHNESCPGDYSECGGVALNELGTCAEHDLSNHD